MIELSFGYKNQSSRLPDFFYDVFSASEGGEEGRAIQSLIRELLKTEPDQDLQGCVATDGGDLLGCIMFSRLTFDQDPRRVFLMSPVAVRTDRQRGGIGQKLITFGLDQLRAQGVDFAITYGDPSYYGKTGFLPISEAFAQPPMPLSQPIGWLGQSLSGSQADPMVGPSRCVSAFDRPDLW
ncbi:GNAT family N-acetyltransferase [Ruegeria faecimaris]|uniref:GNAT family N-acetyltransferase n=1 Tax=Ruegeria faecimaris TaxID=686389 RepID=UPI00232E75AE|nr:N-acetyltransferase [Ruegeria faecimaris]